MKNELTISLTLVVTEEVAQLTIDTEHHKISATGKVQIEKVDMVTAPPPIVYAYACMRAAYTAIDREFSAKMPEHKKRTPNEKSH